MYPQTYIPLLTSKRKLFIPFVKHFPILPVLNATKNKIKSV